MKYILILIMIMSILFIFSYAVENPLTIPSVTSGKNHSLPFTTHSPLDTTIEKFLPLTIEGDIAILQYHLIVDDWTKPVHWRMKLLLDSMILFQKQSIDTLIDDFFGDSLYVEGCQGYIACKQKWYLSDILNIYIDTIATTDSRRQIFQQRSRETVPDFFELQKDTLLIEQFWLDYKAKTFIAIAFFSSPVTAGTPLLSYYPKAKKLIPIYAP